MTTNHLSSLISLSLKQQIMTTGFVDALLTRNRYEVLHRDENEIWDYKQELDLDNPIEIAQFAKDVLGFHNTKGGVIFVGVSNDYKVVGIHPSRMLDTSRLIGKIRKYIGPNVSLFQDSIRLSDERYIWLIFIPRRTGEPQLFASNGPAGKDNKPIIQKDRCFMRVNDETRPCVDPGDYARLFSGHSAEHLLAYLYDLDEPYYRLLAPHCDKFVGREEIIEELMEVLGLRHPVIALDGLGGVGKSAIAIELVSRLYSANRYLFIISLSAKNKVWHKFVGTRMASFSGMTELLREIAKVMCISHDLPTDALKEEIIKQMEGTPGLLLIDNIEEIDDPDILRFLSREIPPPVKIIVTSRVDKKLGALTVSIPEMTEDDARELLYHEFYKVGYTNFISEQDEVNEILSVTGGIPLALKWAAALADNSTSLKQVSHKLRQSSTSKNEFLNFCFATMFDALSPMARDVAILCPYLGDEWNTVTISIALNAQIGPIKEAIGELKDRGILLASGTGEERGFHLLPLTLDFLANKWHENASLKEKVKTNLSEALASMDGDGLLFNWPNEKRVEFLRKRILESIDKGDYERAHKLSDLITRWSKDSALLFLHGKIDYLRGHFADGISAMKIAIKQMNIDSTFNPEDQVFLGNSLIAHGDANDQRYALELLEDGIAFAKDVSQKDIKEFCKNALSLREYSSLRRVLEKPMDVSRQFYIVESLWDAFDKGLIVITLGSPLVTVLKAIAESDEDFAISRKNLLDKAYAISNILIENHRK